MMRHAILLMIVGMPLMLTTPNARGQGTGFVYGAGGAFVFLAPNVQQELKFTAEQKAKVRTAASELGEKYRDRFMAVRDLPESERRAKLHSLADELIDDVKKTLSMSPEQARRYDQIVLQQRGLMAFNDPGIREKLRLTGEQQQTLGILTAEVRSKADSIRRENADDRAEAVRQFRALRKEYAEKALKLLSGDQQKTWETLTGEPFEVKYEDPAQ